MKLSHGDTVIVTTGKDKGKKGTIMRVLKEQNRVIVAGINMVTKHVKKTTQEAGKKIKYEVSISASNVAILDPKSGKATRVGYKVENGHKVRFAKKSGTKLERVKVDVPASAPQGGATAGKPALAAKPTKKAPFWKKVGFGSEAVSSEGGKTETAAPASPTPVHRSGGRGA
jgi:large subunit ribosomal protein L24